MLPARGYQLQGEIFRWVYMNKGLTRTCVYGEEISPIQKVCPIHEILFFILKIMTFQRWKAHLCLHTVFLDENMGFLYMLKEC